MRQTHYLELYEKKKMICLPLVLYLILLLDSVLSSLPAPVNLSVSSVNFHHVLRWDPGPGTPPGTQYMIIRRVNKKEQKQLSCSTTSCKLNLPRNKVKYDLTVQVFYNQTLSPESRPLSFTPYEETTIGPPKVSLAGCGNCIRINISLPEADRSSRIVDVQKFYGARFRILWRKNKEAVESILTQNTSYTMNNLQPGMEYCVQVHTEINVNKHTEASAWSCTFTSIVEPSRDPVVVGAFAALLIFAIGILMSSIFCLYYTGFLCKLKATLPRVLIEVLSQGYTLTPERTLPDKISISADTEKQRMNNNPTVPQSATRGANSDEEDEDEEEEGVNIYMERDAGLSSGESSCQDSADVSGNSKVAASGTSGSLTVEAEVPDTESEVEVTHGGLDQDEAKPEGAEVSFMPEGGQTRVQGCVTGEMEEEDKEEVCDSSGNINLFSVTLASLAAREEMEEEEEQNTRDSLTDFLKLSDLEPLLSTDSTQTLRHTDSQAESDNQTTVARMLPTQNLTMTGYEGRLDDTLFGCRKTCDSETQHGETQEEEEQEEEEDEEEFSGYMAHT